MASKKLRLFSFFGIHLESHEGTGQAVGTCPFCGKENHFYVNEQTGQWDCKSHGGSGNAYTFISQLHESCLRNTTMADYNELARWRKLSARTFQDQGLAKDEGNWLFPVCNQEGRMVNLHVLFQGDKQKIISSPGLSVHLIGLSNLLDKGPIYLCEGFWDTYAMRQLVKRLKKEDEVSVLGTPGANTFKQDWAGQFFSGRVVNLLFDNDPAGDSGMERTKLMLSSPCRAVHRLRWPASAPDGMDISDIIKSSTATAAWKKIHGMLGSEQKTFKPKGKITFPKIIKAYRKYLHIDDNMERSLAVIFATAISIQLPGDPLWVFLVGPPGSGKTALLKSTRDATCCQFESRMTAHSLISGYKTTDGSDPSLLPKLRGRCLVLRDYTEIISMPAGVQEELYGTLRQAYDGSIRTPFGNQVTRNYDNCYFSLIAGVTDIIHGDERATLGERFLKMNFIDPSHNPELHVKAALNSLDSEVSLEREVYGLVSYYLDGFDLKERIKAPKLPSWVKARLLALAQLVGILRTTVHRTRDSGLAFRSRPEIGTRIAKQVAKLLRCLAVIYHRPIDKGIYEIGEQVALDTIIGWHREIITYLINCHPEYASTTELATELRIPMTTLRKRLENLLELGIILRGSLTTGLQGRPSNTYKVNDQVHHLWQRAKIGE